MNESVANIFAEWRECIEAADPTVWDDARIAGLVKTTKAQQLAYLDRIEAAWKRQEQCYLDQIRDAVNMIHERVVTKHPPVGNAAAMREALEMVIEIADREWRSFRETPAMKEMRDVCTSALSSHPRNCDVGTAEEQLTRYIAECRLHHCNNCPLGNNQRECGIYWSQIPYVAEEGTVK